MVQLYKQEGIMDTYDTILKRRSIRKFTKKPIPRPLIEKILNAARLSPTGMNMQPLKFYAIIDSTLLDKIFPYTKYAGYMPNGECSPSIEEGPTAIVLILTDLSIRKSDDVAAGAAAMSMILTAQNEGVSSCWMMAIDKNNICNICDIDQKKLSLHSLISFGYPAMTSRAEPMNYNMGVKYYFDEEGTLCVPKRHFEDVCKIL